MKITDEMIKKSLETSACPSEELNKKILKESKKMKKKHPVIKSVVGIAAAFAIGVTAMCNIGPDTAYAMQSIPVIGVFAKLVTFRTYEDKEKGFEAIVEIPELEETSDAYREINIEMKKYCDELIAMYKVDKEATDAEGYFNLTNTANVITNNEKYLTIKMETRLIMAGTQQVDKYFTIDKEKDEILKLENLFDKDFDYKKYLYDEVVKMMKERMEKDDSLCYFLPGGENDALAIKEIPDDVAFFINEKGNLVLSFDKYEVAPGYMGIQTFEIQL